MRDLTAPFGGCGISGIGREGGDYALDFYSELKTAQVKEETTAWVRSSAPRCSRHIPTIVLPDDERRALNDGQESTLYTGLYDVRREVLDVLRPDLVVVFDSHWFTTVEFVVAAQARRAGRYTSEELPRGMSQVPYDIEGDPEFAEALAAEADARRGLLDHRDRRPVPARSTTRRSTCWASCRAPERWVSVSVGPDRRQTDDFLTVGECVARAVARLDRRVLLVGSGALSHTFWPLRELRDHEAAGEEHIFTKEAAAADHGVLDRWSRGDHARGHRRDARVPAVPPRGPLRPLPHDGRRPSAAARAPRKGRRYSAYENAIGTGQAHVVFDRPDGGWTA